MIYKAHNAPVYSVQKNPMIARNFLTVGDWSIKIWTEDFNHSCIIRTKPSEAQVSNIMLIWRSNLSNFSTIRTKTSEAQANHILLIWKQN